MLLLSLGDHNRALVLPGTDSPTMKNLKVVMLEGIHGQALHGAGPGYALGRTEA
jgi:hypothetical protein